ncbi:two-component regulator propeller domain-containing protein [Robiginitalea sp. IMCC43444]|uniref:two-component regulator propeller domain-containing protein n=1 Tax=Robiginitalea sp. IMCC43444 TaxID=3459121 RepID=UPI0040410091
MTQDHQGNIWMTSEGLMKYDGENFIDYSHISVEKDDINSINLECIYTDRDGIIWIGSKDRGLIRFDPVTETHTYFQHKKGDPGSVASNAIKSIVQDHDGGLWIGTLEGLDYFDTKTNQFQNVFGNSADEKILSSGEVRVLYVDRSGTLWAGVGNPFYFGNMSEGGLYQIDIKTKKVKRYSNSPDPNSLVDNRVTAILEDSKGNFWVGTAEDGLHIMDRQTGDFTRYPYDPRNPEKLSRPPLKELHYGADHIRFIVEDIKGFIWIGTIGNGINRYDPLNKTVSHFGPSEKGVQKLPWNHFWSHLQTKDGLLWVGGWLFEPGDDKAGALMKIDLSPIGLFEGELGMGRIQSFIEDNAGNIYMISGNNLVQADNLGNEKIVFQFNDSNQAILSDIVKDETGNFWISSNRGLFCYSPETNLLKSFFIDEKASPGQGNQLNTLEFISADSLIVGARNGLYLFHKKQEKFTEIPLSTQNRTISNPNCTKIFIDSKNVIWLSFRDDGLKRLDLSTNEVVDYPVRKDSLDWVNTIYEDEYNHLYIGNNQGGLHKYDRIKDRFSLVKDQTGLLNEDTQIFGISRTRDSILWLSNLKGLIKYDLVSNKAFMLSEIWGVPFPNTSTIYKSSNGNLYMGKDGPGYIKFRPEELEKSKDVDKKPFISSFRMDGKLMPISERAQENQLIFSHNQNNIILTLGYVNFDTGFRNTTFQYKLENYDEQWREARKEEKISYFKLKPGDYNFTFKVIDIYGETLANSLSFKVRPPWWFTWWAYCIYGLLFALAVWATHRFQKAKVLRQEREKIKDRELAHAREIEKAYSELKQTQNQLIQSEKMASLGELTAGIAHEIKNPLNFVNNFSEVSMELLEEMQQEIKEGNLKEAGEIAKDLTQNLEKIVGHGQRADGIVRSMLLHSRSSDGKKEPTDLNALANEYLRLAYHGLRARDKSFNAAMETDLDPKLPKVNVVPQEIGRVLLNLFTNAYQAVSDKKQDAPSGFEPRVIVKTRRTSLGVEITVMDNGKGIPEAIRDKIFQPFFTTKPTGQGTGLGLSLSYDIVKAHGGDIAVESEENAFTKFTINLPLS